MDAVFYLLDALKLFKDRSLQEVKEITFEIGMLGRYGLDINDPKELHVLRSLPGGLQRLAAGPHHARGIQVLC